MTVHRLLIAAVVLASAPSDAAPTLKDPTLARDAGRVARYLAKKSKAFASVELLGWTANHELVYRTAVCDDNDLGDRGPFCQIDVCTLAAASEPDCASVVDTEPDPQVDRNAMIVSVTSEEASRQVVDLGTKASARLDRTHDDIRREVMEPTTATPGHSKKWRPLLDEKDYGDRALVVRSARKTTNGACTGLVGTGITWMRNPDRATYGGPAVPTNPFAFAVVRCK